MMNKDDLQKLVDIRVNEANVLFKNQCYIGAYYLLGYAVECALKAIIAKQVNQYDFPDKKFASDSHTHRLNELVSVAKINQELIKKESDNAFKNNWTIAKDWSETIRYMHTVETGFVTNFFKAILDEQSGILMWLKSLW